MRDRHIARGQIDDPAGNEERRHPARAAVAQHSAVSAMPSTPPMPEPIRTPLTIWSSYVARMPIGVIERLLRRAHGVEDEIVDFALLLRLHPLVGIEGAVGAVAARNLAGDLARDVGDFEFVDAA